MKILIIQLARLGDIYLTWPSIRAIKRTNPEAEVHVLCRSRFKEALDGLDEVDQVHCLDTAKILKPILGEGFDLPAAVGELDELLISLKKEKFDQVCNLSYSKVSSYLSFELTHDQCKVLGYTRFSDGYLSIPDDTSAYFSAQVGPGRPNRIHLSDIFAMTLDLDLVQEDWRAPNQLPENIYAGTKYICLHIGASQSNKMYPVDQLCNVVALLLGCYDGRIVLIGSEADRETEAAILANHPNQEKLTSMVGRSTLLETMSVLKDAQLLIGADSGPIHMASLVDTKTINLSNDRVNFWETGPRARGSIVVKPTTSQGIDSEDLCDLILAALGSGQLQIDDFASEKIKIAVLKPGIPSYLTVKSRDDFAWELTRAIYIGDVFPECSDPMFFEGLTQLLQANDLILEQIRRMREMGRNESLLSILSSGEEVIAAIAQIVPALSPIVRWYQTEKLRIGPGSFSEVLLETEKIQLNLEMLLQFYLEGGATESADQATLQGSADHEADAV